MHVTFITGDHGDWVDPANVSGEEGGGGKEGLLLAASQPTQKFA